MSNFTEQKEIRLLQRRKQAVDDDVRSHLLEVNELERTVKTLEREIAKLQNRQQIELERLEEYKKRRTMYELKLDELNEKVKKKI